MKKTDRYNMNDVNSADIPEFVYDSLARSLLPVIQQYYESDEGKLTFAEWTPKSPRNRTIRSCNRKRRRYRGRTWRRARGAFDLCGISERRSF